MNEYFIGIGLMAAGAVIFFVGRAQTKRTSVQASNGSVAVGGDNRGIITNTNIGQGNRVQSAGWHIVTVLAILVELAGIAVTLWHATHLDAK
jgi:hypothetical protein